jgi:hypothetical protein
MVAPIAGSRLTPRDMIAAAGGAVLVVSLFLPWYGVSFEMAGFTKSDSGTGREVLSSMDMLLFLISLAAIAVVAARAAGAVPDGPARLIELSLGALAVLMVLYRIIDIPTEGHVPDHVELSRKGGIFIALVGAAAITYGGRRTTTKSPARPHRTSERLPKGQRRPEGRAAVGGLELRERGGDSRPRGRRASGAAS